MNWNKVPVVKLDIDKIPDQIFLFATNWEIRMVYDFRRFKRGLGKIEKLL